MRITQFARRTKANVLLVLVLVSIGTPRGTRADGVDVSAINAASSDPTQSPARYGWQIAAVDVGAVALIAGGGALTSMSTPFAFLPILGGATYFVGGPLVHLLHEDDGGAGRSVLLRVALPVGAGALGAGIAALSSSGGTSDVCYPHDQRTCAALWGAGIGIGVGMIAAMVTDWILASEPPRPSRSAAVRAAPTWFVTAAPLPGGSAFGIAGQF